MYLLKPEDGELVIINFHTSMEECREIKLTFGEM